MKIIIKKCVYESIVLTIVRILSSRIYDFHIMAPRLNSSFRDLSAYVDGRIKFYF